MASTVDRSVRFPVYTNGSSTNYIWHPGGQNLYLDPGVKTSGIAVATRTRTGQRFPNWHKVIIQGGNATTPLTARYDTIDSKFVRWRVYSTEGTNDNHWNNRDLRGDILLINTDGQNVPVAPAISTSFADNLARAKFYKRLREVSIAFSGGTFLGELRETLHMLRRPASALYSSADGYLAALNKRKRASPKHWTKSIGGLWLEHSFGWMPLIHDVNDAIKAYERAISEQLNRKKIISGGGKAKYDRSSGLPFWRYYEQIFNQTCRGNTEHRIYEEHTVRYKGAIRAQVETTRWDNWKLFGFTTEDVIPTAWELLPWSFLVDYFTNIGDILTSVTTSTSNVSYVNKSVITKTEFFGRSKLNPQRTANIEGGAYVARSWSGPDAEFLLTRKDVTRSAGVGITPPTFQMSLDLSNKQLMNVAALLTQSRSLHPQNPRPHRFR